tara:strand:+ start:830 stop:1006 length:177 start_codon:yes stop_codon:yes gene_type:complete
LLSKINKLIFYGAFAAILINIFLFGFANVTDDFKLKILSIVNVFLLSLVLFRNADDAV